MPRKRKPEREPCTIHDHFDGSANCVECGGWCELHGDALILTELVRTMFERWAMFGENPWWATGILQKTGLNIGGFFERARETNCRRRGTEKVPPPLIDRLGTRILGKPRKK